MTMIEHQKQVLKGISNSMNKSLFKKELIKSLLWLKGNEQNEFVNWVKRNFYNDFRDVIDKVIYNGFYLAK